MAIGRQFLIKRYKISRLGWLPPWLSLAALASFIALSFLVPGVMGPPQPDRPSDSLSSEELAGLLPGDVVLRKGSGFMSDLISVLSGGGQGISHSGLVATAASQPGSALHIVHSLSASLSGIDGIRADSPEQFAAQALLGSLVVVRPRAALQQRLLAGEAANRLLASGLPFDNRLNFYDRSALYCSELIVEAFEQAGIFNTTTVYPLFGQFLSFELFFNPQLFEIIIDHRR